MKSNAKSIEQINVLAALPSRSDQPDPGRRPESLAAFYRAWLACRETEV